MSDPVSGPRRVLLDEMLPRLLARELPGHDVTTVAHEGWSGIVNGELLRRAEAAGIEVFVTADRNMEHQQRLLGRSFGVVVLLAGGTKLEDLRPLATEFRDAVARVAAGEVVHVRKRV
jgi:predicted nuclease of predicted toxin-antitoxin system